MSIELDPGNVGDSTPPPVAVAQPTPEPTPTPAPDEPSAPAPEDPMVWMPYVPQPYGGGNGLTDEGSNVPFTGPPPQTDQPPPIDEFKNAQRYQQVIAGLADPWHSAPVDQSPEAKVPTPSMSWDDFRAKYPNMPAPPVAPMYGQIPEFADAIKRSMPAIPPDVLANNPQLARAVAAAYSAALATRVTPEEYDAWTAGKLAGAFGSLNTPAAVDAMTQTIRDALGKVQAPFQWFGENIADPLMGGAGLTLQALAAQPLTLQTFADSPGGATVGAILRMASGKDAAGLPPNTTYQSLVWAANRRAQLMKDAGNPQDPISQARIDGQVAGEVWRGIAPTSAADNGLQTFVGDRGRFITDNLAAQDRAAATSKVGLAEPFAGAKGAVDMLNPAWLALGPLAKGAGAVTRLLPLGEHAAPLIESYIANAGMPGMDRVLGAAFSAGLRSAKVGTGALRDMFNDLPSHLEGAMGNANPGAGVFGSREPQAVTAGARGRKPPTPPGDESKPLMSPDSNPGILSNVTDRAPSITNPGQTHQFTYKLVDANDLILSHHPNGVANAAYPAGVQPRARERVASQAQVDNIARNLDSNLMLSGGQIDRGTPIVGPGSNVVESGNGRGAALIKSITDYADKYGGYRSELERRASEFGFTPEMVKGMQHPVLVRERVPMFNDKVTLADYTAKAKNRAQIMRDDSAKFAAEANNRTSLDMSPSEKAIQDAGRVHDRILSSLSVGENQSIDQALLSSENAHLRSAILGGIPETERASLADAEGNLNRDGLERLKAALFAKTFPGPEGQQLLNRFRESIDPGMKNIEAALFRSLPSVAKAEGLVRGGQRSADMALGQDLAAAVNELERIKATPGANVATEVAQLRSPALFAGAQHVTPAQTHLIEILDRLSNKPKQLTDFLRKYAELVDEHGAQGTLMGGVATRDELIDQALAHASPKEAQMGLGLEGGDQGQATSVGAKITLGGKAAPTEPYRNPTSDELKAAGLPGEPKSAEEVAGLDNIVAHEDSRYAGERFGDMAPDIESEQTDRMNTLTDLQERIDNEELKGKRLEKAVADVGRLQGEYDSMLEEVRMAFGDEAADFIDQRARGEWSPSGDAFDEAIAGDPLAEENAAAVEGSQASEPQERQPWQAANEGESSWGHAIPPTAGMSEQELVNDIGRLHEVGGDQRTIYAHEKALDAMRMPLVHEKGLEIHGEGHGNWYYVTKAGESPNYGAHANSEKNYMGPIMDRGAAIDMALTNDFVPGTTPHIGIDRGPYSRALTQEQADAEGALVHQISAKTQADQKALYASLKPRDQKLAHSVTSFQGDWNRIEELKTTGASDEDIYAFLTHHDNIGGGMGTKTHLTSKGGYIELGDKGAAGYEKITAKKLVGEVRRIFGIRDKLTVEHGKRMDAVVKQIDAEHAANPVKPAEPGEVVTIDGSPAKVRGVSTSDGTRIYDVRSDRDPNTPHYFEEGALGRTSEGEGRFLSSHGTTGEAERPHAGDLGDLEIKQQKNGKWIATRQGDTSRNALFRADSREALVDSIRAKESRMAKNERTSANAPPPPPIGETSSSGRYHSAATGRYVVHTDGKIVDASTGKVIQEKGDVNDARKLADKMDREAKQERQRAGNLEVSEIPMKGGMKYGVRDDNTGTLVGPSFGTRAEAEADIARRQTIGGKTAAAPAQGGASASTAAAAPKVTLGTPSEAKAAANAAPAAVTKALSPEDAAKDALADAMVDHQRIGVALSALPQERTSGMSHQVLASQVRKFLAGPTAKSITGEVLAQTDGIREALGVALKAAKLPSNRTNRTALADALIEREKAAIAAAKEAGATQARATEALSRKPTSEERAVSGGLTSSPFQNVDIGKIVEDHLKPAGFPSLQAFTKALREGGDVSGVVDGVRELFELGHKERGLIKEGYTEEAAKAVIARDRERLAKSLNVEKAGAAPKVEAPPIGAEAPKVNQGINAPPPSSRVLAARESAPPEVTGPLSPEAQAAKQELEAAEDAYAKKYMTEGVTFDEAARNRDTFEIRRLRQKADRLASAPATEAPPVGVEANDAVLSGTHVPSEQELRALTDDDLHLGRSRAQQVQDASGLPDAYTAEAAFEKEIDRRGVNVDHEPNRDEAIAQLQDDLASEPPGPTRDSIQEQLTQLEEERRTQAPERAGGEDVPPPPNVEGPARDIAAGIQKAAPADAYANLAQQMRDAGATENEIKGLLGKNYVPPRRGAAAPPPPPPRDTAAGAPPGDEGPRPNTAPPVGHELVHEDIEPNRIVQAIDLAKSNALSDPFAAIGRHTVQYAVGHPGSWLDTVATFMRAVKGIGRDDAGAWQSLAAIKYDKAIRETEDFRWLEEHGMNFWDAKGSHPSEHNDQWNSAMGERFPWIRVGHQDYATAVNSIMLNIGTDYRRALEKAGMLTDESARTMTDLINHSVGSSHVPAGEDFRLAQRALEQMIAMRTARENGLAFDSLTRTYRDMSGRQLSTTQLASQGANKKERLSMNVLAGAEAAMKVIRRVLVSPRYTVSRFQTVGDTLRGLSTMVPGATSMEIGPLHAVSRESAKALQMHAVDMAKWYGTWLGLAQVLSMAGLADTSMDPRSSDFGSIRLKNGIRFDPFEGTLGTARLVAQSTFGQVDKNGKMIVPGQPGYLTPEERMADYLTHRLSPVAGVLSDMAMHQSFGYKGFDIPSEALNLVTPGIAPRDIVQAVRDGLSVGDTLWIAAFNTAGLNASKTGIKRQNPIGPAEIGGAAVGATREGLKHFGISFPESGPSKTGPGTGVQGWQ